MISKEEWQEIKEILSHPYGRAVINADTYRITLSFQRITHNSLAIVVFINGELKNEWVTNDCEERTRFYSIHRSRKFRGAQQFERRLKDQPKTEQRRAMRLLKAKGIVLDAYVTYYLPWWTNFNALRAHLLAHNKELSWDRRASSSLATAIESGRSLAMTEKGA